MPKVRMLTTMAGPAGTFTAGQAAEVDGDTAEALVSGGFAEVIVQTEAASPVDPDQEADGATETATAEPPENAMRPAPKRRRAARPTSAATGG